MGRGVGPVLSRGVATDAVVEAIRACTDGVTVIDRGGYLRVTAPGECRVTRVAIEQRLGRAFRIPQDLELIMPSFSGRFLVDAEGASWR